MKKLLIASVLILMATVAASAQSLPVYASSFAKWSVQSQTPVPASGSATVFLNASTVTTIGGPTLTAVAAHTPLLIDQGSPQETVTPSSVSCQSSTAPGTCSFTATFSNAHSGYFTVQSGSYGLQEAINYEQSRGGGLVIVTQDFGGTTSTITGAYGYADVEVLDQRNGHYDFYGAPATGSGYQVVSSISGITAAAHGLLEGACTGTASASSTLGLYGLGTLAAPACTSTTVNNGWVAPAAGTLRNLSVSATTGGVSASSGVFTVLKNGSATTITCTTGTATSCSDTTHSASYVAGDIISIEFTTQSTETLAGVKASVSY